MNKKISISITSRGIQNLEKIIEQKKNDYFYKMSLMCERLSEIGVEIARIKLADFNAIFSGELINSIHNEYVSSTKDGVIFAIITDNDHAAFVEFGTGQFGLDTPYPYKLPDGVSWEYAIGQTIRKNSKTGRYYWFYPGKDGKWHYTEGMRSRPFMYETASQLKQKETIEAIAREIFGR